MVSACFKTHPETTLRCHPPYLSFMEAAFQSYARAMKEVEDAQRKKEDIEVGSLEARIKVESFTKAGGLRR